MNEAKGHKDVYWKSCFYAVLPSVRNDLSPKASFLEAINAGKGGVVVEHVHCGKTMSK